MAAHGVRGRHAARAGVGRGPDSRARSRARPAHRLRHAAGLGARRVHQAGGVSRDLGRPFDRPEAVWQRYRGNAASPGARSGPSARPSAGCVRATSLIIMLRAHGWCAGIQRLARGPRGSRRSPTVSGCICCASIPRGWAAGERWISRSDFARTINGSAPITGSRSGRRAPEREIGRSSRAGDSRVREVGGKPGRVAPAGCSAARQARSLDRRQR